MSLASPFPGLSRTTLCFGVLAILLMGCTTEPQDGHPPAASASATSARCPGPSTGYRPRTDRTELRDLMMARDFSALEHKLDSLQRDSAEQFCSDRPFALAFFVLSDGSPASAAIHSDWIAAHPRSAHALAARGQNHLEQGLAARGTRWTRDTNPDRFRRMRELFAKADADLSAALVLDPAHTPAGAGLLKIASHVATLREKLELHERLSQSAPNSYLLGKVLADSLQPKWGGHAQTLRKTMDTVALRSARNPDLAMLPSLADCLLANGGGDLEAMAAFARAQREHGDAYDPVCWIYQARTERRLGRSPDAVTSYQRYFEHIGLNDSAYEAASTLARLGRINEAESLYQAGLTLNQGNPELFCSYAELEYSRGRLDAAQQLVTHGLALVDDSPRCTRLEVAIDGQLQRDPARRLERLRAVATELTDSASFHLETGRALIDLRKHGEALAPLDKAIEIDDGSATAFYYRALAHEALGNFRQASADASQAASLRPDEVIFRTTRARLHISAGRDPASAVSDLKPVADAGLASPHDLYALAGAYYKQRDCEVLPTLRKFLSRCGSERCNRTSVDWANRLLTDPAFRSACPQHF